MAKSFDEFLPLLRKRAYQTCEEHPDVAHDCLHIDRVVANALFIAKKENGDLAIVLPAAYLHDCIHIEKDDPRRSIASRLAKEEGLRFLESIAYPTEKLDQIGHAIEAHSFTANLKCKTLEAQIVQDADRLDGLGSVGLARMFAVSSRLNRSFYNAEDPLCRQRTPDDKLWGIDHFFVKLVKIASTLNTPSAQAEGRLRLENMAIFLKEFERELHPS